MFAPSQSKGPNGDQALNDQAVTRDNDMTIQIKQLSSTIDMMKNPTGKDKKNPARSCLDLHLASQRTGEKFASGWYWVDPNAGCEADAIQVFCDFNTLETCVHANNGKVNNGTHHNGSGAQRHVYFGEEMNGYKFNYEPKNDVVQGASYQSQITFLRLLSTQARQQITYHCRSSIAFYDQANGDYNKAVKLLGSNGVEFSAEGAENYNVMEDGCQYGSSSWDKTVFEYATTKTARLPIVDVAPMDIGSGQEFGIEVGPVCFK